VDVFLEVKENILPEKRLPMRQTREILRLHFESRLTPRQIAAICKVGKGTVQRYLRRLEAAGLSWPLSADLDDVVLERRLFPPPPVVPSQERPLPDCVAIHRELKSRKNVTLQLLWEEYKRVYPLGYNYSWYCDLYRQWQQKLDVVMRQEHRAGEKTFVDYAGQTVPVTDPKTGEVRQAQVFVAVLGASSYTYAEATWTQNLWDWIHSHIRAFEFFEGTSRLVIPDNLKSGVKKPCYYEPELNRTYGDLAIHYGLGVFPARPYRARDKAKAEAGVQVVQRWVLAALRKRQFFSLADLNEAILELVHKLNQRPFRKLPGSRGELYQNLDRPALQPLPLRPFVFAEWKKARVNLDYHIELDGHYYSTPYQLVGKEVEVRSTRGTVEIVYQGKRIASHVRSSQPHVASTIAEHRPKSHQEYLEWTPSRIIDWAGKGGPFTARLVESIIADKPHPEMGYRSALGVIRLSRKYGAERLEAACTRAVRFKLYRYQSVKSMLECGLDSQPLPELVPPPSPVAHENLRGPDYYAAQENHQEVGKC
jgi:transposase